MTPLRTRRVEERKDGLIGQQAPKMLATRSTADEDLVLPATPGIREGEERYVIAFGIASRRLGLSFIAASFDAE